MGKSSQRKGADGEREVCRILQNYGYHVQRGGSLSYGSVPDVYGLDGVHLEIKRCEQMRLHDWMEQTLRDAERFDDGLATLIHRCSRTQWLVTMTLEDWLSLYSMAYQPEQPQNPL